MKAIAIIPARLASTRLPRKVLREIAGRPMLGHVYEAVRRSPILADVVVATDSAEIMEVCKKNGWKACLTSPGHRSGTDRVRQAAEAMEADVFINVQGDEPLARPEHIAALLQVMRDPAVLVGTVKTPCPPEDISNPSAVKVVTDLMGRALYFSRATIPHARDRGDSARYFKHLGFYAYRRTALQRFCALPESELERTERLEQLRFLENGVDIYVAETPYDTIGVDTEEDLLRAERLLRDAKLGPAKRRT